MPETLPDWDSFVDAMMYTSLFLKMFQFNIENLHGEFAARGTLETLRLSRWSVSMSSTVIRKTAIRYRDQNISRNYKGVM